MRLLSQLNICCVESLGRFKETVTPIGESFPREDFPPKSLPGQPRTKTKKAQLSAPPDKDPVMLLSEYGQKMNKPVCARSSNNYLIIILKSN